MGGYFDPPTPAEVQAQKAEVSKLPPMNDPFFAPASASDLKDAQDQASADTFQQNHPILSGIEDYGKQAGKTALGYLGSAAEGLDEYLPSGGALRAGLVASGGLPGFTQDPVSSVKDAAEAAYNQYGKPGAPSYTDVAQTFGADPKSAPYVGAAMGVGMGLLNPEGAALGMATKAGPGLVKAAETVAPNLTGAAMAPLRGAGNVAAKLASESSGTGDLALKTYAQRGDVIDSLDKAYGGNVGEYADDIKNQIHDGVQNAKNSWSNRITSELSDLPEDAPKLDSNALVPAITKITDQINPKLTQGKQSLDEITNEVYNEVLKVAGPDGQIAPKDAFDLYNDLRAKAAGAYAKNGQIFNVSDPTARAAKGAAAEIRNYMTTALPETSQAFENYSDLHDAADVMNKNMIIPGKSDAALLTAGSTSMNKNRDALKKLGDVVGQDFVTPAENLAAMKYYGKNATALSSLTTGKSVLGTIIGGTAGYLLKGPEGAALGAGLGNIVSSPMTTKKVLQVIRPSNVKTSMGLLRAGGAAENNLLPQNQGGSQ